MIQKKLLLPFTTTVTLTYLKYKSENLKQCYQLIHCKQLLLTSDHILDIDLPSAISVSPTIATYGIFFVSA